MRWLLIAVVAVSACRLVNDPETDLRPELGHIAGYNSGDPHIVIEPTVRAARVTITTYGSSCNAKGQTQVSVNGMVANVVPFNLQPVRGPCLADLRVFVHDTVVVFPQSGNATIRVRGINIRAGVEPNLRTDTIVVERTVVLP
jgi:hypothetical protein